MAISLLTTNIAQLSLQAYAYGVYTTLFCWSILLEVKKKTDIQPPLHKKLSFIASVILFLTIVPEWIMDVYLVHSPTLDPSDASSPSDGQNFSSPLLVVGTILNQLVPLIGDIIMIYRLYVLWKNWMVCLLPSAATCGAVASLVAVAHTISTIREDYAGLFSKTFSAWVSTSAGLTLFVNVYCWALISWKVYNHIRPGTGGVMVGGLSLKHMIIIFVESAALYVALTIAYVGVYISGSSLQALVGRLQMPATGIAFVLIALRINGGFVQSTYRPPEHTMTGELSEWHVASGTGEDTAF